VVTALLLSSCASVTPRESGRVAAVETGGPFRIEGRLSARRGSEGMTANFTWIHSPPRDDLTVTTPLGQDVAQISGDATAQRVELRTGDGRQDEAPDWSTLTERALGFVLPVAGLGAWVRGAPREGTPFTVEPDAAGRASVLRQDGWEIDYGYGDDTTPAPSRLRLLYADLEVRIVIDRWQ
jgi:outer membrane lipoprotein LolB